MSYHSVKLCLISLLVAFVAQRCCCHSAIQRKKKPDQRTHLALPTVTCSARGIRAVFDPLVKNNARVQNFSGVPVPVLNSERSCGVTMGRDKNHSLVFFSRYDGCYAHVEGSKVVIPLLVQLTGESRWIRVNISCPLIKRSSGKVRPTSDLNSSTSLFEYSLHTQTEPLVYFPCDIKCQFISFPVFPVECDLEKNLRIDCGYESISSDACTELGCCYDAAASTCYYKLNTCSLDGHFVFTVKSTDTHPPIDPSSLVIKDHPLCIPAVTTADTAVFKIGVMDCGAEMRIGHPRQSYHRMVAYLFHNAVCVELIGKRSKFSLQVQCEYEESDLKRAQHLRSLYTVTNPPPVVAQGTISVQMRIATDASFTSFFAKDQLPLISPLRKAVNVEISIVQPSPDPTLSLHVRDCFAYPASKHSVWTLLQDGCTNPLDNMRSSVPVDNLGKINTHSQVRRFDVKTFAFLDPDTGLPSKEEMYFYCWVEICTDDVDCAQRCSLISSEGDRRKRRAIHDSRHVQLVSSGPLVLNYT
ncbi:zona pellucida sperm-binding protein 4-like [Odontesthes bonariensis]